MDAATRTPTRPDWPTRTFAPLYHRLLDRIDRGLAEGAIEAYLPDGTRRLLGGHAAGPLAVVRVVRWRALRLLWLVYPFLVAFVIVATANHFILDALLGALTAATSAYGARWLARARTWR